jgi:hypothetical protein
LEAVARATERGPVDTVIDAWGPLELFHGISFQGRRGLLKPDGCTVLASDGVAGKVKLSFIGREARNVGFWKRMFTTKCTSKSISLNVQLWQEVKFVKSRAGVLMSKHMDKEDVHVGLADRLDDFFDEVIVGIHGHIGEWSFIRQSLGDFGDEALVVCRNFEPPLVIREAEKF